MMTTMITVSVFRSYSDGVEAAMFGVEVTSILDWDNKANERACVPGKPLENSCR